MQRGHSRTAYVLAARESSNKARKRCGKEGCKGNEEVSTKYYSFSNILKIITLAFIAVMSGFEFQMDNDLKHRKGNIQSVTNLTLESIYFEDARVYRYKGKLKIIPSLLNFTQFGFGMGPGFTSDIAGDGPRKRKDTDDECCPELQKIKKKKSTTRK